MKKGFWMVPLISLFLMPHPSFSQSENGKGPLPRKPLSVPEENFELPEKIQEEDFIPYPDRWNISPPPYELNVPGAFWDPYNQNRLKGDVPVIGQNIFLNLTGIWDTLVELRTVPTPSGISAAQGGSQEFFGDREQFFLNQNFLLSADLFKGDTAFKPFDWRLKGTMIGNINYLKAREQGVVHIDVREGTDRTDGILALQELFLEVKIVDLSPNYDFISVRAGIHPFNSDFRGFIFSDMTLGVRLFGNLNSNRYQYNLAYFERLEKDTNSGLNTLDRRDQRLFLANLYRQDFLLLGLTSQISVHHLREDASFRFDENQFLARPDPIGSFQPHALEVTYLGWTGSGHIKRINIEHALYYAMGQDDQSPISERTVDIEGLMAALELSYDRDWFRIRTSYFYASGDDDPTDEKAEGFDAVFDQPVFAGGGFSYWNRNALRLTGTGVALVNRNSLLPDLRSSKEEGQPNFVNPGIHIFTVGLDLELTPKTKGLLNANYLLFDQTEVLEFLLFQIPVRKEIGWDASLGLRYRPFLNNNVIVQGGVAVFFPGTGFQDIYESEAVLFSGFANLTLTF